MSKRAPHCSLAEVSRASLRVTSRLTLLCLLWVNLAGAAQPQTRAGLEKLQRELSLAVVSQTQDPAAAWANAQRLQGQGLALWANAPNAQGRAEVLGRMQQWGLLADLPAWNPQAASPKFTPADLPPPPNLKQFSAHSDLNNLTQPLVVHFWAQWCGPCRHELPQLARFYAEQYLTLQSAGIALVTVNNDPVFDVDSAAHMDLALGQLPVLHDPDFRLYRRLAQTHDVALPATFLLQPGQPHRVLAYGPMQWLAPGVTQEIQGLVDQH